MSLEHLKELSELVDGDAACKTCAWAHAELTRLQAIVDRLRDDGLAESEAAAWADKDSPTPHMVIAHYRRRVLGEENSDD